MSAAQRWLSPAQFAAIAGGYGDDDAIAVLNAGQAVKREWLISELVTIAESSPEASAVRRYAELIAAAQAVNPQPVADVIAHPHLDAWATLCWERLVEPSGDAVHDRTVHEDLGHLAGFALAAAFAAGLDCDVTLTTLHGVAHVPRLGTASGLGTGPARARCVDGHLRITGANGVVVDRGGRGWQPLRTVELGPGHVLAIEDQDPYRHCYQSLPLARLSESHASGFAKLLADAWRLIEHDHPMHAVAIRSGIRSVVPLATPASGMTISAASRHAYGAVAVSVPETAAELALLLIHEHMHAKLGAVLDLCDLYKRAGDNGYHAPWRLDPRPVGALFQGVYAHTGVTDYWRKQRLSDEQDRSRADAQFAYWHTMTLRAALALQRSRELTEDGHIFVTLLRERLEAWRAEPVPADIASDVQLFVLGQTVRWRLSNWRADAADVERLAACVRSHTPIDGVAEEGMLVPGRESGPVDAPGVLGVLHRRLQADGREPDEAAAKLLTGRSEDAIRRYVSRLDDDANDDDAWIGLAVVLTMSARPAGRLITDRPDLCRDFVLHLKCDDTPKAATTLVNWLGVS